MIKVSHLTKRYAGVVAVDDLSFDVEPGEVVGFLGPNGAGKSTTMRILAGFIPPTGGEVRVAGFSVTAQSIEVRRRIGYLPEHCPLYPELRVREYLRYRAGLKGVPARRVRARVDAVCDQCGLADAGHRIIGQLSKGFRQRVGLADALVHEPELLILDEPTIGLDPIQIRQVRELIRHLAERHTVLISTHILPEVEMTCRRVLIINNGRLMASDSTGNLRRLMARRGRVLAQLRADEAGLRAAFAALSGDPPAVRALEDGWAEVAFDDTARDGDTRVEVSRIAAERGWPLRDLRREESSLEDIFVSLTTETPEAPA